MTKAQAHDRQEAIARLREWIRPGDTIYCVLAHIARSGMSREIKLYHRSHETGDLQWISSLAARAIRSRMGKHDGIVMGGCGMDMGFAAVYELGHALWPEGTPEPHGRRNGQPDSDGGYALKHTWL